MTEGELNELDLAVAKAEGLGWQLIHYGDGGPKRLHVVSGIQGESDPYRPTRDPVEAMRLMEKNKLGLWCVNCQMPPDELLSWGCGPSQYVPLVYGETPCVAICKAVVALHKAKEPV